MSSSAPPDNNAGERIESYAVDSSTDNGDSTRMKLTRTRSIFDDAQSVEDAQSVIQDRMTKSGKDEDLMKRLAKLTKVLSHQRKTEATTYKLNLDDFDLRALLEAFAARSAREGIELRSLGFTCSNLTAHGIDVSASYRDTVYDLIITFIALPYKIWQKTHLPTRKIIQGINATAKPGEMILVIGRPGAGCSSFLKCIAGEIDEFTKVEGEVKYDGVLQHEMLKKYKSDLIYNPELDTHFPYLTVNETLSFAIAMRAPRIRPKHVSRSEYIRAYRDVLATVFGLRHTYDTLVGNDFIRGISGGERKRVSIAEALSARASIYCWDNATRGLDSSTALEFAQAIRTATNLLNNVGIVAVYQAGENIYKLFDKVTVLYSGRQVYFGPCEKASAFFENMGYHRPSRQTTPEFLTCVTDPSGRVVKKGMEGKVPATAEEFEAYWHASPEYQDCLNEIKEYNENVNSAETKERFSLIFDQEKMKHQVRFSKYNLTLLSQFKLCLKRGTQRIKNDKAFTITNTVTAIVMSLIMGSLFYQIPSSTGGAFSAGGVVMFALLYFALTSVSEMSPAYELRPIIQKQKSYSFYHPGVEALAQLATSLPIKLPSMVVFSLILYFLAGLKKDAGSFFAFFLFLFVMTLIMTALFQMIAALCKSLSQAHLYAGIVILAIAIYCGYAIPRPSMHPWFKWISYINPVLYGFENIVANEFHGREMPCAPSQMVPQGLLYDELPMEYKVCVQVGSVPGQLNVSGDVYIAEQFTFSYSHVWRNLGIMFGFLAFFVSAYAFAVEFLRPTARGGDRLVFKRTKHSKLPGMRPGKGGSKELPTSNLSPVDSCQEKQSANDLEGKVGDAGELRETFKQDSTFGRDVFLWQNVDYTIPVQGGTRKLLNDIQGYVKPGTMTALVGESGAGKTTLLNVLSQRIHFGVITGDMLVNGNPIDDSFQRRTGYVQQQDLHISELTVRESLLFSARVRQPQAVPDQEKVDYCNKIMKLLGMEAYADAIVGDIGRGLNVEQRKKLSIGVELVAKPSLLLFLDEPTSGLDSQSALSIVKFLRELADAGQAILCTIHQPSATLFEYFDRLLLLKAGGRTVYFGDIGANSSVVTGYFEKNGCRTCTPSENPAEYVLECIGAGATATVQKDWGDVWAESPECATITSEIAQMRASLPEMASTWAADEDEAFKEALKKKFATSYIYQFRQVLKRTSTQFWRDPVYVWSKLCLDIFGGLFLGFTFWDVQRTVAGTEIAMFSVFLILLISLALIFQIQDRALQARELYEVRERNSNTYHWSILISAQIVIEIVYNIFGSTLTFCCFYFPLKLNDSPPYAGYFYLMYAIVYQIYLTTFGLWIIYFSHDLPTAGAIGSFLFAMMIAFCGVMQPRNLMPGFWTFMYRVSPYTYFVQSFLAVLLHELPIRCTENEFVYLMPPGDLSCEEYLGPFMLFAPGYLKNPLDSGQLCGYCQFNVGDDYLERLEVKWGDKWRNFGFIWVYIAFNFAATMISYYYLRVVQFNPITHIKKRILWWRKLRQKETEKLIALLTR